MRKYIHIAKLMKPTLTQEASDAICEEYSKLRSQDTMETDVARVRNRLYFYDSLQILHTT